MSRSPPSRHSPMQWMWVIPQTSHASMISTISRTNASAALIGGATYSDEHIRQTMRQCYEETDYVLDPHGACGYQALVDGLKPGEVGVFCETAHPAKFKEKVDDILGIDVDIPARLRAFMQGQKQSVPMTKDFADFKQYLMNQ